MEPPPPKKKICDLRSEKLDMIVILIIALGNFLSFCITGNFI